MSPESTYEQILGNLYEAATDPDGWRPALAALASWTGANEFHLLRWNAASQQPTFNVHSDGVEPAIEQYGAYYAGIDPRRMVVAAGAPGRVLACQHRFEDGYVGRSEFYQDFLGAWGMRRSLSSLLMQHGDEQLMLGLVRATERGSFEEEDVARLERAMPHLQRACRIWADAERLRQQVALGDEASGAAGVAWMGLDAAGAVLHANSLAEELLREDDFLVVRDGRLHAADADGGTRLRSAIAQAARGGPARELTLRGRRSGAFACSVSVIGVSRRWAGLAAVLVMVRRSGAQLPAPEHLAQAFGLTPAESKAALGLLEGKTPAEHAEAAGLSMATVRSHLSAVYAKTCTRRQAEAVQVLRALRL